MEIKMSKDRIMRQMDSASLADFLNKQARPNKGESSDILEFPCYFKKNTVKECPDGTIGINGPELDKDNSKVYISVYHFMQYYGIDPNKYDTKKIGGHLSTLTEDWKCCCYEEPPYEKINKYVYEFILEYKNIFDNFLKKN